MLGIYLLAAIVGAGALVFSLLGGEHDAGHGDAGDVGHDADAGHDAHAAHGGGGEIILGLFRPRNLVFFLAAFGLTGTVPTWLAAPAFGTLMAALAMGAGAMLTTHATFTWLRRSESASDVVSDHAFEGRTARVVLPVESGQRGRVACVLAGQEHYITARLAPGAPAPLVPGREVLILRMAEGVAEVEPFDALELPPSTD
jgi:membrane protein implicated in regulation of membrane protease activity